MNPVRKALIVGIDHYEPSPLSGCISDAKKVFELTSKNENGSPNFDCRMMISSEVRVTRAALKESIEKLFEGDGDMALMYFAGHGTSNNLGGYLVTQDAKKYDEGISMTDLLRYANNSKIKECVIILDCCFSGALGNLPEVDNKAVIKEGVSILTASRQNQTSAETPEGGLFTSLVCDALKGGAADLMGKVTTASVYAHVESIFDAWEQRPLFKTHISKSTILRICLPLLDPSIIRELVSIFKTPTYKLPLDKSYEPKEEPKGHPNEKIFAMLQAARAKGLIVANGEDHLYFAAINNKSCSLTPLGQFYWHLVKAKKI